ncbi:MAG TPA: alkaline phosphatase [Spirochaeta sp.]|nr:alkaline phosphatase [Spirochaeta sp.]
MLTLLAPALVIAAGTKEASGVEGTETAMPEGKTKSAKYIFLFIGDGMGLPQLNAAEAYLKAQRSSDAGIEKMNFSDFPAQGLTTTYSSNAFITDSAAAATAIACGYKTASGIISMDESKEKKYPTIAEMAKKAGMKVGILSSVNLDHATPACFYAHEPTRNNYYNINIQLAESSFDYYGGGMVRTSKTPEGEKTAHDVMKERGWQIASTREELNSLVPGKQAYAYNHGFAFNALDYTIDQESDDISLAEFTAKGIELLDNPNGFFMMIEGGKIDWACHANDAVSSIFDTFAFADAVQEAIDFYTDHPDETLIIVTGDHECGGLTLGFAGTKYSSAFDKLAEQKYSFEYFNNYVLASFKKENPNGTFSQIRSTIEEGFGLRDLSDYELSRLQSSFKESMLAKKDRSKNDQTYLIYGGYEPLTVTITHLLNQRAGLAWTSYSHTGIPVPTFALGVGAEQFNGYFDNTDIFKYMKAVMPLSAAVAMSK